MQWLVHLLLACRSWATQMTGTYFNCSSIQILKLNEIKKTLIWRCRLAAMTTTSSTTPAAAAMSYGINIMYATAAASTLGWTIAQFSQPNNECRTRVQACVRSRGAYLILSASISNSATHSRANKWLSVYMWNNYDMCSFRAQCTWHSFFVRSSIFFRFVVVGFFLFRFCSVDLPRWISHNIIMIAINVGASPFPKHSFRVLHLLRWTACFDSPLTHQTPAKF